METSKSNFLIGLAIGSAIGALAQRFSRTACSCFRSQKIGYYNKQLKLRDVFSMLPDPFHLN